MAISSMDTADAKKAFTETINRVAHHKERIVLLRRGKEIAAIVPIEDLHTFRAAEDQTDLTVALDSLKEARSIGVVSLEDLKQALNIYGD